VQIGNQICQPFGPQPNISPVWADIDPLHEQLHNARLLGREQFVPERIEPLQRLSRRHARHLDFLHLALGVGRRWLKQPSMRLEIADLGYHRILACYPRGATIVELSESLRWKKES
jgi:hypothetical protein